VVLGVKGKLAAPVRTLDPVGRRSRRAAAQVNDLLKLQKETANIEQQIETTREQMQEYRSRMDELHGQILSLREVRTGAALLTALERKMKDISDKVSGATIALVNLQERLMISRVHFQDAVAELTLEGPAPERSAALN